MFMSSSVSGAVGQAPRPPRRAIGVYGGFVVLPLLAVLALVWWMSGDYTPAPVPGTAPAVAPPSFARLLAATAVVVGACLLAGRLARRVGQPAVIGEITCGILLGPSVLGAVWPAGAAAILPPATVEYLGVLSQFGVLVFVFLAGLEIDTRVLRGHRGVALVVSHVGISIPLLLGILLALLWYPGLAPDGVPLLPFALFIGVALSVTALPVMTRILTDTGRIGTPLATIAMTSAMIDDVTAWCLVAVTAAFVGASSGISVLVALAGTVAIPAALLFGLRPVLRRSGVDGKATDYAVGILLVLLLLVAAAAEQTGLHAIFGAFLCGLCTPGDTVLSRVARDRLSGLTTVMLLPLFFACTGLRTDIGLLGNGAVSWAWCGLVVAAAFAGKFAGAAGAARLLGVSVPEAFQLGALMNCRGLTELVMLNVGLSLGVIGPELFTVLVVMALVTTAATVPLLSAGERIAGRYPSGKVS